jgi:O-antigen/teichoic acid export membrane protein
MSGEASAQARGYGSTAGMLTVAIGCAGLLTYLFFALASHSLTRTDYGELVVLWSAVFIAVSTLFRPVEQLLSRTISEVEVIGGRRAHALRVAGMIQLALAAAFVLAALALRTPLEDELLSGNETLYWILIASVTAFGASFYARGWLAGSRRFHLYAALLAIDGVGRFSFALALALGVAESGDFVALGIVAGPLLSLLVVPLALARPRPAAASATSPRSDGAGGPEFTLARGASFAAAVLMIMLSEQVLLNGGPLFVRGAEGTAAAGLIFNVLMVARAPVVLFQAVTASLLPHLTRLRSRGDEDGAEAFRLSIRLTVQVIASLAALTTAAMLIAGPDLMQLAFGDKFAYERSDLVIVAIGMGLYLTAGTFNQGALAQGQARSAAGCWIACAIAFAAWNLAGILNDAQLEVVTGFSGAAALLCALLYVVYRRPGADAEAIRPGSPEELELQLASADEAG